MKFQDNLPIYRQIETYLYRQIALGKYQPGDKIPSVRQLAVELTVNINTVQRALMQLNEQHVLYVKRGQGNFVTQDRELLTTTRKKLIEEQLNDFFENMSSWGLNPKQSIQALNAYYSAHFEEEEHHDASN